MRDGLYQVTRVSRRGEPLCAGFVIAGGRLARSGRGDLLCAPVLRRSFGYWSTVAVWVSP